MKVDRELVTWCFQGLGFPFSPFTSKILELLIAFFLISNDTQVGNFPNYQTHQLENNLFFRKYY